MSKTRQALERHHLTKKGEGDYMSERLLIKAMGKDRVLVLKPEEFQTAKKAVRGTSTWSGTLSFSA